MNKKKAVKGVIATVAIAATALSTALVTDSLIKRKGKGEADLINRTGKMNYVFILADDQGYMDTALNGSTFYETPYMQALAKDGVTFTNAYAHPLCSPTRSCLLSGQYPHRTMINNPSGHLEDNELTFVVDGGASAWQEYRIKNSLTGLPTDIYTIGQAFQDDGYTTALIGKHHLGKADKFQMGERGFDVDYGMPVPGPGSYYPPYFSAFPGNKWDTGDLFLEGEHITDRLAREADRFISESVGKGENFFLELWDFSIHGPFQAKKEYVDYFKNKEAPGSDQEDCCQMAAMLKALDNALGKVIDSLKRNGIYENTVIVFMGDNGGNMYDGLDGAFPTNNYPLRQGKGTIYEGGIRVPCIVKVPGIGGGKVIKENIHAVDFYPTLIDIAGIRIDPEKFENANHASLEDRTQVLDGMSLVPLLEGSATELDRPGIFTNFIANVPAPGNISSAAINSGDWKLIINYESLQGLKETYELYNLKDNISETLNLASLYPEKVQELKAYIEDHQASIPQSIPKVNPAYSPNAQVPIDYIVWDNWVKEFSIKAANDDTLSEYPKVVFEDENTIYTEKIKDSIIFRIGSPSILNNSYDDKVDKIPKREGKKIYLPSEILGLKGQNGYIETSKIKDRVTLYDDLIIVSKKKLKLTEKEIIKTHAYLDSFDKSDEVRWLPNTSPSITEQAKNKLLVETFLMEPEDLGLATISWDFKEGLKGFSLPNPNKGNLSTEEGKLKLSVSESDAFIHSPRVSFDAASSPYLILTFKNVSEAWQTEIYWITSEDGIYNAQKKTDKIYIEPNSEKFVTYYIDMSQYANWKGQIAQIRFDCIDNASSGYVLYDSIVVADRAIQTKWTFEENDSGFKAANNMLIENKDGLLVIEILGKDAYMIKSSLSIPLDDFKGVKIKYKNTTNSTVLQVFYTTVDNPNFAGQYKTFTIKSRMTDFEEIILDMSDVSKWSGILTRLRIDPADTAQEGVFYFESIEIVG